MRKRILTPRNLSLVFLSFSFLAGNAKKGLKTVLKDSSLARARIITKKGHCSLEQRCNSFFGGLINETVKKEIRETRTHFSMLKSVFRPISRFIAKSGLKI